MLVKANAPFVMAMIFSCLGGIVTLGSLYSLLNSYIVKIGKRGIYAERRLLGIIVNKRHYPPSVIKYLFMKSNGSTQYGNKHIEHFVVRAKLTDGKHVNIAESLNGRGLAELALDNISMLTGYAKSSSGD